MLKFKEKVTRGDWDENGMKQAILCVKRKEISIRESQRHKKEDRNCKKRKKEDYNCNDNCDQ